MARPRVGAYAADWAERQTRAFTMSTIAWLVVTRMIEPASGVIEAAEEVAARRRGRRSTAAAMP